ncbi:phosphoserine phosphatase 1 [bacterium BMS3Abin04]|nr:phosphoserine phosphatase 1 [bacterium BMS3Abin04]
MKKLFLIRHAKSSWKDNGLADFDRPLNKRGKRDAPFMGKILKEEGIKPDLIITSPAKRTCTTARVLARKLDYPKEKINSDETVYEASPGELIKLVNAIPSEHEVVMLIGHNPGLTQLSNLLTGKYLENIPTTGIVEINFNVNSWEEITVNTGKLKSFEYPKKYLA